MATFVFSAWPSEPSIEKLVMTLKTTPLVIAQFSDCHLFADKNATHCGANVWQNLLLVLADIGKRKNIDYAVFTGDLTQDHTEQSYQYFAEAIEQAQLSMPIYFLAGNHDERALLSKYLTPPQFETTKNVETEHWQIQLLDSKSDTPSGLVSPESLLTLTKQLNPNKYQLLMMHHHPINIGYYIDKHGLINKDDFWQTIIQLDNTYNNIQAIACGHVHRASRLSKQGIDIYTCPATSVQFGETKEKSGSIQPSYRLLYLASDGAITSEIVTP